MSKSEASDAGRLLVSFRKSYPKVYRPCRYCKQEFGCREVRVHHALCPENPKNKKAAGVSA